VEFKKYELSLTTHLVDLLWAEPGLDSLICLVAILRPAIHPALPPTTAQWEPVLMLQQQGLMPQSDGYRIQW
jgi:hypothetical protein